MCDPFLSTNPSGMNEGRQSWRQASTHSTRTGLSTIAVGRKGVNDEEADADVR